MDKVAETSALAELSALYEIASLAPSDSEEGFAREAMEKAARLSGVRRFALFKGPVRHGHLLASWGFKSAREIPRRLEQNEPNQIRFDFGADGELGTLVMEQPGPIGHSEERLYAIFARRIEELLTAARDVARRNEAEEQARYQRDYFRALFEGSPDAVVSVDMERRVMDINPAFERMFGYSLEDIRGSDILDCHIPEGKEVEGRDINRRIAQGETVITETVRRRADGRGIPVLLRGGPVVVEGKQVGILEMYRDISDRKKAEEEARYQRDYFQALFDGSPDGVVSVDMERRIRDINPAFEKMFGYGLEEIRGKDVLDYILLESEEAEGKAFSHRISHGEVVVTETVRKRADGTEIPVSLLGAPVIVEGKQVGILGIYRDITERKRAEADARYQRNYFRALFEGSPEGVVSIDMERRVTDMNPAFERIFGYSLEEVKGKDILDYILSEGKQREGKDISRRVGQGELIVTETVRKRADGTEIAVSLLGAPVMVEDRQVGILGIYRDITEHKRAEEEREALVKDLEEVNRRLGESNRELQDFAYVASHDLREPLRKVASFGTLLEESLKDRLDEDQRENFDYMIDGARRMQAMVDDLLTYSRLATRARPPERVDLNGVIEELKSLELAALLEETGGSIAVPEPLPAVQCDPSQVRQLLQNLIGNGLKFRREGIPPEVSVHAGDVEGGMVRVELRDNGIGIDEKDHEQVFTMFKRLHPRDRYGGTGIGLAVCKRIVDRHGGEIGVESGPGEGSTFWFTLPRGKPQGKKQRKE